MVEKHDPFSMRRDLQAIMKEERWKGRRPGISSLRKDCPDCVTYSLNRGRISRIRRMYRIKNG